MISWRHGEIPALLTALGVDAIKFVPEGHWPDTFFDRVIELQFDAQGNLDATKSKTIKEKLTLHL